MVMVTVNLMFNNDIFRSLLVNVYLRDYSFSYKKYTTLNIQMTRQRLG